VLRLDRSRVTISDGPLARALSPRSFEHDETGELGLQQIHAERCPGFVAACARDLGRDRPAGAVSGRFHRTLAAAILEICRDIRGGYGVNAVCLAGGVFQNDLLVSDVAVRLSVVGFDVYVPHAVPAGDGGISLGQVVVANARSGG